MVGHTVRDGKGSIDEQEATWLRSGDIAILLSHKCLNILNAVHRSILRAPATFCASPLDITLLLVFSVLMVGVWCVL